MRCCEIQRTARGPSDTNQGQFSLVLTNRIWIQTPAPVSVSKSCSSVQVKIDLDLYRKGHGLSVVFRSNAFPLIQNSLGLFIQAVSQALYDLIGFDGSI